MFINSSSTIGQIIATGTSSTTGSLFVTLLMIIILIMAMAILFGINIEYTAILIIPLLLSYMSYYAEFYAVGSVILIYISIILTKIWLFK